MRRRSIVVAFLVAPLAAPIAVWFLVSVEAVVAMRGGVTGAWMAFALYFIIGAPAAYAAAAIVGIPGLMVAHRWGFVSRTGTIVTGAATGSLVAWLAAPELKGELVSIPLGPWRGAIAGAAVGFVWFALASRQDERAVP